jgi:regulator of RNase E activity RraA
VNVQPGDIVVADEESVVVTPSARREEVLTAARAKLAKEADEALDAWQEAHRARIDQILGGNA